MGLLRFLELKEQATNKLKDTETEQETEPTKYADVSETVCHHELFEGESSQNVIEDIKKKCDTSGIIGKLDGTNTGNAAGGDKEKIQTMMTTVMKNGTQIKILLSYLHNC